VVIVDIPAVFLSLLVYLDGRQNTIHRLPEI